MLWSIIYCSSHFVGKFRSITTHTMAGLVYVRSEVLGLRSAGERHTRLWIVEIDKIGIKYSMHKIVHVKHWEMCTSSLEGCIAHWNMNNRQSGCKVRYLCQSGPEWQWPVMLSTELQCVSLCTVEIYIRTVDRQD